MSNLTVRSIGEIVAAEYKIPVNQFFSHQRQRNVAWARQVAMYLAYELTGRSMPQIGRAFDRDHTTVVYAVHKCRDFEMSNEGVAHDFYILRQKLMQEGVA